MGRSLGLKKACLVFITQGPKADAFFIRIVIFFKPAKCERQKKQAIFFLSLVLAGKSRFKE